jgi:gamma-tubulin complex component 3
LCHFLHHELSEYHRLLAVLESQLSLTAPTPAPQGEGALDGPKPAEGAGLTLMRLGLWTEEMKLKMRMMNQVVDDAKGELPSRPA